MSHRPAAGDRVDPVMSRRAIPALLAAAVMSGGCSFIQGVVAESLAVPATSKAVAYKAEPGQLISTDGTWCRISTGKFGEVEVGDHVLCTWSDGPAPESGAR